MLKMKEETGVDWEFAGGQGEGCALSLLTPSTLSTVFLCCFEPCRAAHHSARNCFKEIELVHFWSAVYSYTEFPPCPVVVFTAVIISSREKTAFKWCDWQEEHLTLLTESGVWELGAALSPCSPWATWKPGEECASIHPPASVGLISWLPGYVNICILRILSALYQ